MKKTATKPKVKAKVKKKTKAKAKPRRSLKGKPDPGAKTITRHSPQWLKDNGWKLRPMCHVKLAMKRSYPKYGYVTTRDTLGRVWRKPRKKSRWS